MLIAIDSVAERYGMLPHRILEEASTFDLYVLNAGIEYRNRQQAIQQAGASIPTPHLSQEEMLRMVNTVKQEQSNGNNGI